MLPKVYRFRYKHLDLDALLRCTCVLRHCVQEDSAVHSSAILKNLCQVSNPTESRAMHTIFVSSTYIDLQPERNAVREAILRLQQRYFGMEYFGSDPERPKEVSLARVERSSVYLGIIAHRYGTIDEETDKSITQLEYEAARQIRIPTLMYFKDSKCPIEPTSQFIDFDPPYREKLAKFKELITSDCTIQTFTSPDDLAAKVTADLAKLMNPESLLKETPINVFLQEDNSRASLIPMVGEVAVGKSVYGCMLTHSSTEVLERNRFTLETSNEPDYDDMYEGLRKGEWAPLTQRTLFFSGHRHSALELTIRKRIAFGSRLFRLRIFDTAGEEWGEAFDPDYDSTMGFSLSDYHPRATLIRSLTYCNGLAIFLPVKESSKFSSWQEDWESFDLRYANIIAQIGRDYTSGHFPRPVAIILTKCDLTPELLSDPDKTREYLKETYPMAYSQIQKRLRNYSVFSTSAVGAVNAEGKPYELHPIGLWEPIIWILNEL